MLLFKPNAVSAPVKITVYLFLLQVICVLLLMAVGLALGCAVIGVAGALLLK